MTTPAQQRNNYLRSAGLPLLRLLLQMPAERDPERSERLWRAIGAGAHQLLAEVGPPDPYAVEIDLARLEGCEPLRRTKRLRFEYL